MDPEQRTSIEKQFLMETAFIYARTLIEMVGSEATINESRPHMRNAGHAFAINMLKMFDIKGSDLERIGEVCWLYEEFGGNTGHQEIERTEERIVRVSTTCPWKDGHMEVCIGIHEIVPQAICEEINPDYTCRLTQMMTRGDPLCSWVIENKKK